MNIETTYFDDFVQLLRLRKPFTFSRWGDGEWRSVLDAGRGANCDGHQFFAQMGEDLRQVLYGRPDYLLGMQPLAARVYGEKIEDFLRRHGLQGLRWLNADVLHRAAIQSKLPAFIDAMKGRPLILVGPDHLKRISTHIPYTHFVDVPPRNCYLAMDRIIYDVLNLLEGNREHTIVSISASMPAEIIIDRLHKRLRGQHTIFDAGSLWDPYAGVYSRRYMKDKRRRA